jgi:hypothetical protein
MGGGFTWEIAADLYRGNSGWPVRSKMAVEILGDETFLGVSLSTERHEAGNLHRWLSRSSTVAWDGKSWGETVLRYSGLEVTTYPNPDPVDAAAATLRGHLKGYQIAGMADETFKDAFDNHDWIQEAYWERVAEPIATATLAFCRSASLRGQIQEGRSYWCVSRWTLEGNLASGAVAKALNMGFLAQDILVVDSSHPELHRVKTALLPGGHQHPWP